MPIQQIVTMGQLASNCYTSEQARANGFAQALQVVFPLSATALNYGSATPSVDQQNIPWIRLNSNGSLDGLYVFTNGFWTRPNPIAATDDSRRFYRNSIQVLATYDGGEGTYFVNPDGSVTPSIAITSMTGPMWTVDTDMYERTGVGISNPNAVTQNFTLNTPAGELTHLLSIDEQSPMNMFANLNNVSSGGNPVLDAVRINFTTVSETNTDAGNATLAATTAHNNVQPSMPGLWIKRTARVSYRL